MPVVTPLKTSVQQQLRHPTINLQQRRVWPHRSWCSDRCD